MADTTITLADGFPPLVGTQPRYLILGSMPGVKSLDEQQYYAHPRNAFWPIMATLFNFDPNLPYNQRCQQLTAAGVAVWDVIARCHRPGSLDSNIDTDSLVANDFTAFFDRYPSIESVLFNGTKAESVFKQVKPMLNSTSSSALHFQRLPSTSPAHAALTFDQKLQHWRQAFASIN